MNPRYTYKNRHGTYYFRYVLTKNGQRAEFRLSLGTQDRSQARLIAMRSSIVVTQSVSKGVHNSRIVKQIIKNSIDQMHNTPMNHTQDENLQIGPDLVSLVDIAGRSFRQVSGVCF